MGMVEFVGLVKVNIIRGTNLAVRDVMTSDPYVILNLGHQVSKYFHRLNLNISGSRNGSGFFFFFLPLFPLQSMKTRVIKSNLNPVWNERLMLSIPDPIPPLKLVRGFTYRSSLFQQFMSTCLSFEIIFDCFSSCWLVNKQLVIAIPPTKHRSCLHCHVVLQVLFDLQ